MSLNVLLRSDLNKVCRICMEMPNEDEINQEIFDVRSICDIDKQLSYSQCLYICTQIDLYNDGSNDDLLPQYLCSCCCRAIHSSYNFYNKVKQSQTQIENYINSLTIHSKPCPSVLLTESNGINNECMDKQEMGPPCNAQVENASIEASQASYMFEDYDDIIEEHLEEDFQVEEFNGNDLNQTLIESCKELHTPCKESRETMMNIVQDEVSAPMELFTISELISEDDEENYIAEKAKDKEDNCKSIITTKPSRIRHVGSYRCNICNKIFPNYSRMRTHQRSHDIDRLKFLCPHCNRLYCTKQALDTHVRGVHKKTGYTCPICMKLFAIKKNLEIHMRYHTGDFPYECEMCNRKFAQMGHLNTHRNVQHNNVRFGCEYPNCGKFFTSSNSLRNHEFSHSVMPFECKLCHQGFPAKSKLRVHLKRKHDQELTKEELEDMRKFHVVRSKLNIIKLMEPYNEL